MLCAQMSSARPQDTNFFFQIASQDYKFSDLYFVFETINQYDKNSLNYLRHPEDQIETEYKNDQV